jgi:hypothetical protein
MLACSLLAISKVPLRSSLYQAVHIVIDRRGAAAADLPGP